MNAIDAREFFRHVKGKKICWGSPDPEMYFIPQRLVLDESKNGHDHKMYGVNYRGNQDSWYVASGLAPYGWHIL